MIQWLLESKYWLSVLGLCRYVVGRSLIGSCIASVLVYSEAVSYAPAAWHIYNPKNISASISRNPEKVCLWSWNHLNTWTLSECQTLLNIVYVHCAIINHFIVIKTNILSLIMLLLFLLTDIHVMWFNSFYCMFRHLRVNLASRKLEGLDYFRVDHRGRWCHIHLQ